MSKLSAIATFWLCFVPFACGRNDSATPDGSQTHLDGHGSGSGSGSATPTTIKATRMAPPATGTAVAFANVVVTARVSSSKYGKIWVQDQGGGTYSGIELFCNYAGNNPTCALTKAQIDALVAGTVVNVTGSFDSFLLSTAPAGAQPTFEIDAPVITTTGTTMTPVAVDVPAATIAKAQLAAATAEPYKGAYVHVTGGPFTVPTLSAPEFAASCTDKSVPVQNGTTYNGFEAAAGAQTLAVALNFYNTVTYCEPCANVAMPYACSNPVSTTQTFTTLSGIVEPNYSSTSSMVYLQISPTSDADLVHQ